MLDIPGVLRNRRLRKRATIRVAIVVLRIGMRSSTLVERPVFLVGSERSGTTLLRLMLDHHPAIALNPESEFIVTQVADDGAYPDIRRYREWLRNDRVFQLHQFSIDERLDFVELVNDFLNQKRLRDKKDIVGATVHFQFRKLRGIWPRAKYIYLYRDGRDVASSITRMGWAGNVYVAADWWLQAEKEWQEVRPALDGEDWIEVRYEDLVADSRAQLERICTFLGIEYSEKMFDYVKTSTYAAPDVSLIAQWKKGMRKVDVQRLEAKIGHRLLGRGYELSGYPRIPVPWLASKWLYLHSRLNVFAFRIRRFGAAPTFLEILSRRLGLKQVHQRAVRRIDRIINANLR
jgi:hypothetical protein